MNYVVLFEDAQGKEHLRAANMQAHLGFLKTNQNILRAGPLFDGDAGSGGMWHVGADSRDAVLQLIHADPFWPTGLRKSFKIFEWKLVGGSQAD